MWHDACDMPTVRGKSKFKAKAKAQVRAKANESKSESVQAGIHFPSTFLYNCLPSTLAPGSLIPSLVSLPSHLLSQSLSGYVRATAVS